MEVFGFWLTPTQHSAHELVTVHYPWHALYGRALAVLRRHRYCYGDLLICELPSGRLLGIPDWMTDPLCESFRLGPPLICLKGLLGLRELLSTVLALPTSASAADNGPSQEGVHGTTIAHSARIAVEPTASCCVPLPPATGSATGVSTSINGASDSGGTAESYSGSHLVP